jgi:hypothetical protein
VLLMAFLCWSDIVHGADVQMAAACSLGSRCGVACAAGVVAAGVVAAGVVTAGVVTNAAMPSSMSPGVALIGGAQLWWLHCAACMACVHAVCCIKAWHRAQLTKASVPACHTMPHGRGVEYSGLLAIPTCAPAGAPAALCLQGLCATLMHEVNTHGPVLTGAAACQSWSTLKGAAAC